MTTIRILVTHICRLSGTVIRNQPSCMCIMIDAEEQSVCNPEDMLLLSLHGNGVGILGS